jgi:membrane protease YdiL (CAAX protease family)
MGDRDVPADRESVALPQYSIPQILAVWAAAALPMGALAWLVAPVLADQFGGEENVPMAKALLLCLAAGLIWQFILVVLLVRREQGTLAWPVVREALWLRSPRSPSSGRRGGRLWLILIPLIVGFALAHEAIPAPGAPENRDFGEFLSTDAGKDFLEGAWGWYAVILVGFLFNTVLGEELLFRGLLLPRMNGAFGRGDWVANGLLFTAYHLHVPWAMLGVLTDLATIIYPSKRYRSALIGIAVHSAQSVVLAIIVLTFVL